jgi:hypothetical protein
MFKQNHRAAFSVPYASIPPVTLEWFFARDQSLTDTSGTYSFTYVATDAQDRASYYDDAGVLQKEVESTPRWAYHPLSGVSLGLLLEPVTFNGANYNEQVGNALVWGTVAGAITSDQVDFIDGNTVADKFTPTAVSTVHYMESNPGFTSIVGSDVAQGVYVKGIPGEIMFTMIYFQFGSGNICRMWVDLSDGSIGDSSGSIDSMGVQTCPDDWYLIWCRAAMVSNTSIRKRIYTASAASSGAETHTPNGTDALYICGNIMQKDSRSLRYYRGPLAGGDVTQAEAECTLSTSGWYNTTQGTLAVDYYQEGWQAQWTTYLASIRLAGGGNANYINLYANSHVDDSHILISDTSVLQVNEGAPSKTPLFGIGGYHSNAVAWEANAVQIAGDGNLGTLDTSCTIPTGIDELSLGKGSNPVVYRCGVHIRRLRYWNHPLTPSQLRQLTHI